MKIIYIIVGLDPIKIVQHENFVRNDMQKNFTLHCKLRKMFLQTSF